MSSHRNSSRNDERASAHNSNTSHDSDDDDRGGADFSFERTAVAIGPAMTEEASSSECVFCGREGLVTLEPPRRTLARGADPGDSSFSVIAVLPDLALCSQHAEDIARHELILGWCDDERCRIYGESGHNSLCGEPYKELRPRAGPKKA